VPNRHNLQAENFLKRRCIDASCSEARGHGTVRLLQFRFWVLARKSSALSSGAQRDYDNS